MKILLIWPKFPMTFWGFQCALPFISKKAAFPPLGLITVASLLPEDWQKKIVDLNTERLQEKDLLWADFIFISAMVVQKESVRELIKISKKNNKKIVAGGPLFTTGYEEFFKEIDCFVLGEGEATLPLFLKDLAKGNLKKIYQADFKPDVSKIPLPSWGLIDMKKYASMCLQYSRGCPFNCEFCDIMFLNGRLARVKDSEQILKELDVLYEKNWRGNVFFVDDNFIGNKEKLKKETLPAIIQWQENKKYPFSFNTQASINLADDQELMDLMARAGFGSVFVGIETIEEKSLKECGKFQNLSRNLLDSIKNIQSHGLQVWAGFILGFDNDPASIFDRIINFIQKSKISVAMVGLLQAAPKSRLWQKLKEEKRLLNRPTGNNTDYTLNFIPKMDYQLLISGYKKVLDHIYSPKYYCQRLMAFLREYKPKEKKKIQLKLEQFSALLKSFFILGLREKERIYFWKLFFWCLSRKPKLLPTAISLAIFGFHFRKVSENYIKSE